MNWIKFLKILETNVDSIETPQGAIRLIIYAIKEAIVSN